MSVEPTLVDAEEIFGLPRGEPSHWRRQLLHCDRLALLDEAKSASIMARPRVDVDPRRLEAEMCANPKRGVVDGELPDARDRPDEHTSISSKRSSKFVAC
jgi:hypothetical protein